MNYKKIVNEVTLLIRNDSADARNRIEQFLIDCIEKFLDWRDWNWCKFTETITLNNSGSYDLSTLFTNYIHRINSVYRAASSNNESLAGHLTDQWTKVSLDDYNRASVKTRVYAIDKKILYAEGTDFDLSVSFVGPGPRAQYPMALDADEPEVIKHYGNIISKWVAVDYLIWLGDFEMAQLQQGALDKMLMMAKRNEAREAKRGKKIIMGHHNRW